MSTAIIYDPAVAEFIKSISSKHSVFLQIKTLGREWHTYQHLTWDEFKDGLRSHKRMDHILGTSDVDSLRLAFPKSREDWEVIETPYPLQMTDERNWGSEQDYVVVYFWTPKKQAEMEEAIRLKEYRQRRILQNQRDAGQISKS